MLNHEGLFFEEKDGRAIGSSFLLLIYGKDSRSRLSFLALDLLGE